MFHLDKIIFYDGFISFVPTSPNGRGGGGGEEKSCKPLIMMDTKSALKYKFTAKTDSLQPCK